MVNEANVKQAAAEKQLKEAQGKVCVLFLCFCPNLKIELLSRKNSSASPKLLMNPSLISLKIGGRKKYFINKKT